MDLYFLKFSKEAFEKANAPSSFLEGEV